MTIDSDVCTIEFAIIGNTNIKSSNFGAVLNESTALLFFQNVPSVKKFFIDLTLDVSIQDFHWRSLTLT